jgi:hypothetical protein
MSVRSAGSEIRTALRYWRLGVDDEGWRASKREWIADVEAGEVAAPAAR